MEEIRSHVLNKLYGLSYPSEIVNLSSQFNDVYDTLSSTIIQHRGHQTVLVGPRSSGKTLLVTRAIEKLSTEFPDQFIVVKINGQNQGEDRLALRSIARQLDKHINNGDDDIEKISMSQTLKSVNKLFEYAAVSENPENRMNIIFIVEELDKFSQTHQVLAYELLDLSQSCPFGVAFVGTSTRFNLVDLLEKRNRSRNTALTVTVPKPESAETLRQIGNALLRIDDNELLEKYPKFCNDWQKFVAQIDLEQICETVYFTSNSVRHLCSELQKTVFQFSASQKAVLPTINTSESLLNNFENVSELEWALLISAARSVVRYNTQTVNFVIVLDEWRAAVTEMQHNRIGAFRTSAIAKPGSTPATLTSAKYAWERLIKIRLLEPSNTSNPQEELKMYIPELDLDDLRSLLPSSFSLYSWTKIAEI